MKKILSFILVAIMLVTMSFALVACNDEEQGGGEQGGDGKVKYKQLKRQQQKKEHKVRLQPNRPN